MKEKIAACGVSCSGCAAFRGQEKGPEHQKRTAAAWNRIYHMRETADRIACAGCLGPDDQVFHSSLRCKARTCCLAKGFSTCAACGAEGSCPKLEKAQSVWDGVPKIAATLSAADREAYALPYMGHRARLAALRRAKT